MAGCFSAGCKAAFSSSVISAASNSRWAAGRYGGPQLPALPREVYKDFLLSSLDSASMRPLLKAFKAPERVLLYRFCNPGMGIEQSRSGGYHCHWLGKRQGIKDIFPWHPPGYTILYDLVFRPTFPNHRRRGLSDSSVWNHYISNTWICQHFGDNDLKDMRTS